METVEYEGVLSSYDISKLPISVTTTDVNLTGSWKFFRPFLKEKLSPCTMACPSNINISKYIISLVKGNLREALDILRNENPFPAVCGRVCPHFCQFDCNRSFLDEPVAIKEIEKFLGDYGLDIPFKFNAKNSGKKVAIVGSGPSGMTAAYFLRKYGVDVTIFEKEDSLGGMLRYGIPEYRLPKTILDKELKNIIDTGVTVQTSSDIDPAKAEALLGDYDAVFVATGLWNSKIPDNFTIDNKFLFKGVDFLKNINRDHTLFSNQKIAVIGGGNVAIDISRTLKRLKCEPTIIYRRTLSEMPAFEDEVNDAIEEKIQIIENSVIDSYSISENRVTVSLSKVEKIIEKEVIKSTEKTNLEFDKIIFAIGQDSEYFFHESDSIFIGGDLALGPSTVTESIASGKRGAFKILNYLKITDKDISDNFFRAANDYQNKDIVSFDKINTFYFEKKGKIELEKLSLNKRLSSFQEIYKIHSLEDIVAEAKRCFNCGLCNKCGTCWFCCPDVSVEYSKENDENINFDYDHCKGCSVCSSECPRGVIEMEEDK